MLDVSLFQNACRRLVCPIILTAVSLVLVGPSTADAGSARGVSAGANHTCAVTRSGGVRCWGDNAYGQLGNGTVTNALQPVDVTGLSSGVAAVASGLYHTCAQMSGGGVKCWGDNTYGQLGDGSTTRRLTPVDAAISWTSAVTAGSHHTCAINDVGGVRCWGENTHGQLGNSTTTGSTTPVSVTGLGLFVRSVSAAGAHSCAVMLAGDVKCWGGNGSRELGDGTTTERTSPVLVGGLGGRAVDVASGLDFSCALLESGGIKCWGANARGQLGAGSTADALTPVDVTGLTGGVAWMAAGDRHACAVKATGALECWGANDQGQLGDNGTADRTTPEVVGNLAQGAVSVSGGASHTCALLWAGGVRCIGRNSAGQVGDGTGTARLTAVTVTGFTGGESLPTTGVKQVAAGEVSACALTSEGGVMCWGNNSAGLLGDGTSTSRSTPVKVQGLGSGVASVGVGRSHACALTSAGGVKCWGLNGIGQLGDGTTTTRMTPVTVNGLSSGAARLYVGEMHSCVVMASGSTRCWGFNSYGQLGDGTTAARTSPVTVVGLPSGVTALTGGDRHTCAMTTAGAVLCWGDNNVGQLGNGTTVDALTPTPVSGLAGGAVAIGSGTSWNCALISSGGVKCWGGGYGDSSGSIPVDVTGFADRAASLSVGMGHACVLTIRGAIQCWGGNGLGELGDGTTTSRTTPVTVTGMAAGMAAVAAGGGLSCALTARGGLLCWGQGTDGQLGNGSTSSASTPKWVSGFIDGTGTLTAGESHACRVHAGGVQCWGSNSSGQIGDGTTMDRRTPVDTLGLTSGVASVAAGAGHSCAVTSAGRLACWGANDSGQLGDATTTRRETPVTVLASGAAAVAAGGAHTCALTASGGVLCWGDNSAGALGDGTTVSRSIPGLVVGLPAGAIAVAAGASHSCALTAGGGVYCWGANTYGQIGNGETISRAAPAQAAWLGVGGVALTAGDFHTCVLMAWGNAKCWGKNERGQVGDGTTTNRVEPFTALSGFVTAIGAGAHHSCAVRSDVTNCWGSNDSGQLGDGTTADSNTPVAVTGLSAAAISHVAAGGSFTCAMTASEETWCWGGNLSGQLGDGTPTSRSAPRNVRATKLDGDFDADGRADVAVFRPSAGTWFSLNSSAGNASYLSRGWGVQALGDTPVPGCDFDGDGIVDPTVFRPSTGSWFILESGGGFATWHYVGWGTSTDTLVPADFDGDGRTDAAVYRASTGTWYVLPSGGAPAWTVTFGNATDVPIPGHFDGDGKADIAVYRPSTGTWFVLTSSSGYASYWYKGWGVEAQGDVPAPGDYDGDGKVDLCVFRPTAGSWFILESYAGYSTWTWFGWGTNGDTVAPSDYDGDGITDGAVYRPSNHTWYVRPSGGSAQWSIVFGEPGDVPLVEVR